MNHITKKIKNTKFSTSIINLIYEVQIKKEELLSLLFMSDLLTKSNSIYKKDMLYNKEKLKRYIISFSSSVNVVKNNYFINFSIILPNDNLVKDEYVEEAITFILDSIYNPYFNKKSFDIKKRSYTENLLKTKKNINFIAEERMIELIDKDSLLNKFKYKDLDYVKKIKLDDVIDVYNKYLKCIEPKFFIDGNIDENKINNILNNYYSKLKLKTYRINKDFLNLYPYDGFVEKREQASFYQSVVYMIYKVENIKEEDIYKIYLINLLLSSSSSDLLLIGLRKQNNLVYSCGSSLLFKNGILIIKALTSKANIDNVIKVIKLIMDSLNNIEKYKDNINNIMYRLYLNTERKKDIHMSSATDTINKYFKLDNDLNTELDILSNITENDMYDIVKRLKLSNIYILEGDLDQ